MLEMDIAAHALKRGDIGTVVELYPDEGAEVEFVTAGGFTRAVLTLSPGQFSPLDPHDMLSVRRPSAA